MKSARTAKKEQIPVFTLYGEDGGESHPEFLHLEDIASRSARHGWGIAPHAHPKLFQVCLVISGEVHVRLDENSIDLVGPGVVTIPPAVVHGFQLRPNTDGFVLTIAEGLMSGQMGMTSNEVLGDFLAQPYTIDLRRMPEQLNRAILLMQQIALEFSWGLPHRSLMLQWLVSAFLLLIHRYIPSESKIVAVAAPRVKMYERFRSLIEKEYRNQRTLSWYAGILGVTEARLNRACSALSGRSATEIIQDRIVLEARRLLTYTVRPVSAISYDLGFKDHAYFCRYFRRYTGSSPSDFRRNIIGAVGEAQSN